MLHRTDLVLYPAHSVHVLQLRADHLVGEGLPCTVVGGRDHHIFQSASLTVTAFFQSVRKFDVDFHQDLCADVVWPGGTALFHAHQIDSRAFDGNEEHAVC